MFSWCSLFLTVILIFFRVEGSLTASVKPTSLSVEGLRDCWRALFNLGLLLL